MLLTDYSYVCRDAGDVTVTVLGNGHGDPNSNPRRVCFLFTIVNMLLNKTSKTIKQQNKTKPD